MKTKEIIKRVRGIAKLLRATNGEKFRLGEIIVVNCSEVSAVSLEKAEAKT